MKRILYQSCANTYIRFSLENVRKHMQYNSNFQIFRLIFLVHIELRDKQDNKENEEFNLKK